jgi:hypothetical protein
MLMQAAYTRPVDIGLKHPYIKKESIRQVRTVFK